MKRTRVLVLGASGMLGHKLLQVLHERYDVFGTSRSFESLQRCRLVVPELSPSHLLPGIDALDFRTVEGAVGHVRPEVIVNCVGVVKQSDALAHAVHSIQLNAMLPHQLASLCAANGARLIHLSTDCVYSGRRGNYAEADPPDPIDFYGRSKLLGEVESLGCLTLRTSIIGWEIERHRSLLGWLAQQRGKTIRGFRKAVFSGLSTSELARLIGALIAHEPYLSGLYHVASDPISKFDLLIRIRDCLGWNDLEIQPDEGFSCDRSLDGRQFSRETGWEAPSWEYMIRDLAQQHPRYEFAGCLT